MDRLEEIDSLLEAGREETVEKSKGNLIFASRKPAFRKTGKEWVIRLKSGMQIMYWSKKRQALKAWEVLLPDADTINYGGAVKKLTKAGLYR